MAIAIVSGALANKCCNGGNAWTRLNWILGLRRLGFEVYFLEQLAPAACHPANGAEFHASANVRYLRRIAADFCLEGAVGLIGDDGAAMYGRTPREWVEIAASAELLIN